MFVFDIRKVRRESYSFTTRHSTRSSYERSFGANSKPRQNASVVSKTLKILRGSFLKIRKDKEEEDREEEST